MMILMGVVVIVPRLIFSCFDMWRMGRFKTQTSLSIDSPYYANILVQCAQDAVLGNLLIITSLVNRPLRDQTTSILCKHWGSAEDSAVKTVDFDDEEANIPAVPSGTPPHPPSVSFAARSTLTPDSCLLSGLRP